MIQQKKSRRIKIMGFRIQNNLAAMNAQRNLGISDSAMGKSLERLSSGYRINSAKDDAAGLAISQGFRADIASVKVAQRNISEANALLQTAEGAMNSIGDILTRMKELATQAASANVGTNIDKVSNEYNTLVSEIDRIANSTKYAGEKLLDGNFTAGNTSTSWAAIDNISELSLNSAETGGYTAAYATATNILTITRTADSVSQSVTLQDGGGTARSVNFTNLGISFTAGTAFVADTAGAAIAGAGLTVASAGTANFQIGYEKDANSRLSVTISALSSTGLTLAANDVQTAGKAYDALAKIDSAVGTLSDARGAIGAYQNRLSYGSANLAITAENFTAADSAIRDVDMASEMTSFTKNQILVQAGTSMLAQANMASQGVLSLFQ
jgi:flagellin